MATVSFAESMWIVEVFHNRKVEFEEKAKNGSLVHGALLQAKADWHRAYSADTPKAKQTQARQEAARCILNLLDKISKREAKA